MDPVDACRRSPVIVLLEAKASSSLGVNPGSVLNSKSSFCIGATPRAARDGRGFEVALGEREITHLLSADLTRIITSAVERAAEPLFQVIQLRILLCSLFYFFPMVSCLVMQRTVVHHQLKYDYFAHHSSGIHFDETAVNYRVWPSQLLQMIFVALSEPKLDHHHYQKYSMIRVIVSFCLLSSSCDLLIWCCWSLSVSIPLIPIQAWGCFDSLCVRDAKIGHMSCSDSVGMEADSSIWSWTMINTFLFILQIGNKNSRPMS